ncbi:unnamed protein product, partial [Ectocarpus sp. 12 AP-2014]
MVACARISVVKSVDSAEVRAMCDALFAAWLSTPEKSELCEMMTRAAPLRRNAYDITKRVIIARKPEQPDRTSYVFSEITDITYISLPWPSKSGMDWLRWMQGKTQCIAFR